MPNPTNTELKHALVSAGFEVYRSVGEYVVLADRVRDNLIMDSGVSAAGGTQLCVRFVVRAQYNDFPGEGEEQLFKRARGHASASLDRGYIEVQANVVPIRDPGDRSRTLDTWYEITFEKRVADLAELFSELNYALSLDKTSSRA